MVILVMGMTDLSCSLGVIGGHARRPAADKSTAPEILLYFGASATVDALCVTGEHSTLDVCVDIGWAKGMNLSC